MEAQLTLISSNVFARRIAKLLAGGSIEQDYYDRLYAMWKDADSLTTWFGLIGDKGALSANGKQGTNYYPHEFVIVMMDRARPIGMGLALGTEGMQASAFATTMSNGQPLKGKYTYQARLDFCNYGGGWATE